MSYTEKKIYLKTCSAKRHVFPLRFIYSQAKCRRSLNFKLERQIKLTCLSTNFNFAPSKKERTLIINKSLDLSFFTVFYFSTKYLIMLQLGKVADKGPHANCTSHSQTFPPPIDLQPSFWASVNNRESPSLDNLHILFANITERYSRNTNICQLCSLIQQYCPGVPRTVSQISGKA